MRSPPLRLMGVLLTLAVTVAGAQPVYKCEANGKVVYSHDPCLGAAVVDIAPTQGLDKSGGTSRKGDDVRRSEHNRAMSEALRPLLRETPQEYEKRHRRARLLPEEKLECAVLDAQVPSQEQSARTAAPGAKDEANAALLKSRMRFRGLRC